MPVRAITLWTGLALLGLALLFIWVMLVLRHWREERRGLGVSAKDGLEPAEEHNWSEPSRLADFLFRAALELGQALLFVLFL